MAGDWVSIEQNTFCVKLTLPDQICDFPYCQPYNSYNVSSENLVLDQLINPKLIFFFILITYLVDIVLYCKEKFCLGHSGIKGLRCFLAANFTFVGFWISISCHLWYNNRGGLKNEKLVRIKILFLSACAFASSNPFWACKKWQRILVQRFLDLSFLRVKSKW